MIFFSHPAGFFALLAVPAVLAIHFLQRESRRVLVSTLFLLDSLAPESAAGRRIERLRNSVPLWLQLLAVLLLTWLIVQPRWVRRHSVQQIVLLLDSSVSMGAFHAETMKALETATARLARAATTTEWQLLETDPSRPALYAGSERARLLEAAQKWEPHLGTHDFRPALSTAQTLLRGGGALILVTDRPTPLPEGLHLLAVGHPLENCGFTGVSFEGRQWKALVRNYGQSPQQRSWWIEAKDQKSPPQQVSLAPGQSATLTGELPEGVTQAELVLQADDFTLDDRLPLVLPEPKMLGISWPSTSPVVTFYEKLVASLAYATPSQGGSGGDLRIAEYDSFAPRLPAAPAIVFVTDPAPTKLSAGELAVENDPLTDGLNWSGLIRKETVRMPPASGDRTLVWQGDRPLVFLRPMGQASLLVVNFDLRASNADRLPAFVLLLQRFTEQVRAAKRALVTENVECNQPLEVTADPAGPAPTLPGAPPGPLRAPFKPQFFLVEQAGRTLLRGAAQFADAREADFHDAARSDDLAAIERKLVERNSEADLLAPIWLLVLGAAMAASWSWRES